MGAAWRAEWNLGQPGIDEDHRNQYALVQKFINLPTDDIWRDDAGQMLKQLRDLTGAHCEREEKVMRAIRYPNLAEHQDQHKRLATMLEEMINQVEQENPLFPFAYVKERADRLLQFWFLEHFAKSDMLIKPYIARAMSRM
jgi:hemerythrin